MFECLYTYDTCDDTLHLIPVVTFRLGISDSEDPPYCTFNGWALTVRRTVLTIWDMLNGIRDKSFVCFIMLHFKHLTTLVKSR